jgi:hypothetical protein
MPGGKPGRNRTFLDCGRKRSEAPLFLMSGTIHFLLALAIDKAVSPLRSATALQIFRHEKVVSISRQGAADEK